MKTLLYILILSIFFNLNAKSYIFESNANNTVINTIRYPDGKEYIHSENTGLWKDSNGDYGNEKCIGVIKKNKNQSEVEVRCEHTNQNNEKFWTLKTRNSELHESGGGISTYIAGLENIKN